MLLYTFREIEKEKMKVALVGQYPPPYGGNLFTFKE
jgi:hypothetical protein